MKSCLVLTDLPVAYKVQNFNNANLTTIRQNGPLAGKLLAESLIQHLRTGVLTTASIPAELIVRGSA